MNSRLLLKIKQNGLPWLVARVKRELRSPTVPFLKTVIDALLGIKQKIFRPIARRRDDALLYAIYDLDVSAITYNLVEFLIDAEFEANKNHKTGFVVVFVPPSQDPRLGWKEYDSVIDTASKQWRFQNILVPLTALSPKCRGTYILPHRADAIELTKGRDVYPHLYDGVNLRSIDIADFYSKLDRPGLFDGLRASAQGLRYIQTWLDENGVRAPVITITLRNHAFDPARNSNIEGWSAFARHVLARGYHAVVLPDTDTAFWQDVRFEGISTFRECSWNVGLRMALYESAFLNFFVPNGCAALAIFSARCRYICLNTLPSGSIVSTEKAYRESGHPIGADYLFATPMQRLSFKPDTFENIVDEFERYLRDNGFAARPPAA